MFGDSPTGRWNLVAAYALIAALALVGLALLWMLKL
jgi:hypothetical protein